MAIKWITELILFFQPEDSCRLTNEKNQPRPVFRSVIEKPTVSAKALFWLLISILTGLAIG